MESFSFDVPITKKRFCVYVLLAVLFSVFLILNPSYLEVNLLDFSARFERFFYSGFFINTVQLIMVLSSFIFFAAIIIYYIFRGLVWFIISPGFCIFYLVMLPFEAVFLFPYLLGLAFLSRRHYINERVWLVLSLLPYVIGLFNWNNALLKILVLPFFHLISKSPEAMLGSRFISGEVLVRPLNSSSEKAKMAKFRLSNWWLHIEPYVKHLPSIIFNKGEVIDEKKSMKESFLTSDIKGIKIDYNLIESKLKVLIKRDAKFSAPEVVQKARK